MTKKRKPRIKGQKLNAKQLKIHVLKLFKRQAKKRFNARQVLKKLKIDNSKNSVQYALEQLAKDGILREVSEQKYTLMKTTSLTKSETKFTGKTYAGKVDMTRNGSAYILCDALEDDIFVPSKHLKSALNGDTVEVEINSVYRKRPEGKVTKILKRASEYFIGTLRLSKKYGIVLPDKDNMPTDIYVDLEDLNNAREGEKVVVKVIKWPTRNNHSPIGKITSVLGAVGSSDIEMKAILINNGFELEFPEEVLAQANALTDEISEEEVAKRRDMRKTTTFTIDPLTAKDFDDALSIEYLEDGKIEIGIHIADVTHYVQANTALDKEAFKRSTSVYLVDRVLPMLPEHLSNKLCSLRPHEDKCTFSAVFTFDEKLKVVDRWFGKTLTHSDRRFTYEEAQEILEKGIGDFNKELADLNKVAKALRKQKFKNGAIAFEAEEVQFRLDEEGTPIEVYVKERKDAHMLVEDFMLLANREVATFIQKKSKGKEIPFVYRIHDEPNLEKVADFAKFAKELGVKIALDNPKALIKSFNSLAKLARKDKGLRILEPIAIRTMSKAEYSTDNIGHYGLGFDNYSHFTSPIRRYSDVLAHRILEKNLEKDYRANKNDLEIQCKHISVMERKAMTAERESVKYKQVEFIEKHIGEVFEGYISGMIDRGIFVELKANKCEGMVTFDRMPEPYNLDNSRLKATGRKTGHVLKMGDTVYVKIRSADLAKRKIDMDWVEPEA